jgi:hypothetical protein
MPAEPAKSQAKLAGRTSAAPGLPPYAMSWTPANIASCQPVLTEWASCSPESSMLLAAKIAVMWFQVFSKTSLSQFKS